MLPVRCSSDWPGAMMKRFLSAVAVVFSVIAASGAEDVPTSEISVTSDFEGGSAAVKRIDQMARSIRLSPTAHEGRGWVCWWYFKVQGHRPGETLTLDVGPAPWATPDRAAFSLDGDEWHQTPPGVRQNNRIVYTVKVDAAEAWFAWGPPFGVADAQRLVDEAAARSPHAEAFELCRSREGRPTPALRISQKGIAEEDRVGIWIQARQHAWESGSSWVCKGIVDWLLSDDARAEALRKGATITIVPVMDVDNVALGAGGKNQTPQDHNRDWTDRPYHRAVEAAQAEIARLDAEGRFHLFLDLHNPDAGAQEPFFFVGPRDLLTDEGRANRDAFIEAARKDMTGKLPFKGRVRETGPKYDRNWQAMSGIWVTNHCRDHVVAACLETAWNTPHSTIEGYEQVGRELGLAVERYFRSDP